MVDVHAQIAAVDRGVGTEEDSGRTIRVQTLGQTYRAELADVWDAVTSAERIPRWFLPITGDLRLGGRYQLEGNAGGTVEECAPPADGEAHYRVTWEFGGGAPTWLTIRLIAQGAESTRLELLFTGNADDIPEEMWNQFGPSATGMGWDGGLLGLSLHLSGGKGGIAPEEALAWQVSDEGKLFNRLSADAWAAADIAAGADPATATAAAENTYLMYTGQAE